MVALACSLHAPMAHGCVVEGCRTPAHIPTAAHAPVLARQTTWRDCTAGHAASQRPHSPTTQAYDTEVAARGVM